MSHLPPTQFEFDAHFDKDAIIALAGRIRSVLNEHSIPSALWGIDAMHVAIQVALPPNLEISQAMSKIYLMPEVAHASLFVEPNSRVLILNVCMQEGWFLEEKKDDKSKTRRAHPEDAGGALA